MAGPGLYLVKMASLSLEIGILVQTGVLKFRWIWSGSINSAQSYTRLSLCVYACKKCKLKLCMVTYNYALNSWAVGQNDWPYNTLLLNFSSGSYPKKRKYFTTNNFHTKNSNSEFPQITIKETLCRNDLIMNKKHPFNTKLINFQQCGELHMPILTYVQSHYMQPYGIKVNEHNSFHNEHV